MSVADATSTTEIDRRFFGHPIGLATLFFTELWERFSFYGMRAILVLYLADSVANGGVGMSSTEAVAIYGIYNAMVYLMAVPGGWAADRLIGARKAVVIGAIVIAIGHYVMAVPVPVSVWIGMTLIVLGTGLLKPNISAMVGMLYANDPDEGERRDSGFSLFYMGINVGGFISPLLCGWLGATYGWHWGFGAAAIGMTIAVVLLIAFGPKTLHDVGLEAPDPASSEVKQALLKKSAIWAVVALVAGAIAFATGHLTMNIIVVALVVICCIIPVIYFGRIFSKPDLTGDERDRMKAYIWIFIGAAMFWMIYDQAGGILNLFAENSTSRWVFGWEFPASWLQSVQSVGIIIFAPIFAWIWLRMGSRAPSLPAKFAYAIVGIGLSFILMAFVSNLANSGLVAWEWLAGVFLIQVLSELLLSPVGLSASTKLAPRNMESQVLALWFLASALGDAIGGQMARLEDAVGPVPYFLILGGAAIALGLIFFTQVPRLRRLMGSSIH